MTTLAVTGHRPKSLFDPEGTKQLLHEYLEKENPELVIIGMADGVDVWAGASCIDLGIDYIAAKPWAGHFITSIRQVSDMPEYDRIIKGAKEVVAVSDATNYEGPEVYMRRNRWMVDHSDKVVAIFNGIRRGGTYRTINYAKSIKKEVDVINVAPPTPVR